MNNYLKITIGILTSTIISLIVFVLSYNYFPINIFDEGNGMLGATITTINAGDTLKDSRSVINTNFTNLNNDKMEKTATSSSYFTTLSGLTTASLLNTIGTIVSGIWHGSVIDVLYGGTGRSLLTTNTVLLGNGTSGIATTTAGNIGQFLQLNASGTPAWASSSINQAADYSWTGTHSFAATTTLATTTIKGVDATIGTSSNNLLKLDSSSKIPAVDGSQLTGFNIYNGQFSKDVSGGSYTASTTITHSLGRTPRIITITCFNDAKGATGSYNGSVYSYSYMAASESSGGTDRVLFLGVSAAVSSGYISTFNTTSILIYWVKTGSPTGTWQCSYLVW